MQHGSEPRAGLTASVRFQYLVILLLVSGFALLGATWSDPDPVAAANLPPRHSTVPAGALFSNPDPDDNCLMCHADPDLKGSFGSGALPVAGLASVGLGQPKDALDPIRPTDADSLYLLATAYQADGQTDLAIANYHKAARLVPDFTAVYEGMIESHNGRISV